MNASISFRNWETRVWEGEIEVYCREGEPEPSPDLLADSIKRMLNIDWTATVSLAQRSTVGLRELGKCVTFTFTTTVHKSGNADGLSMEIHRRMHAPDPQDYSDDEAFHKAEQAWLTDGTY